jgi:hypothetical protein
MRRCQLQRRFIYHVYCKIVILQGTAHAIPSPCQVANSLTNKIGDVRTREDRANQLSIPWMWQSGHVVTCTGYFPELRSPDLRAPLKKSLDTQRRALQAARDSLQSGIDNFEAG